MNIDCFARQPLLFGPSPIQRLARLTEHLAGAPALSAYSARVN